MQNWSTGVEGKFIPTDANNAEVKEKVDALFNEMKTMQHHFAQTLTKTEERTNEMNKVALAQTQHVAKTVAPNASVATEEGPSDAMKRREREKKR